MQKFSGGGLIAASAVFLALTDNLYGTLLVVLYVVINILYSFKLKNRPIIDIAIIVAGFFIRVLYGAQLCGIEISPWMYLTVISGSFFMALGKRRNEMRDTNGEGRKVLRFYTQEFLDKNMYMCVAMTNVFYALWAMTVGTQMLLTVPIVILILMRYSFDLEGNSSGDPVNVLLHDKLIIILAITYFAYIFLVIYLKLGRHFV